MDNSSGTSYILVADSISIDSIQSISKSIISSSINTQYKLLPGKEKNLPFSKYKKQLLSIKIVKILPLTVFVN